MNAERNLPPRCGQVWKSMENEIVREFLTKSFDSKFKSSNPAERSGRFKQT